jgi:hypothetical protein
MNDEEARLRRIQMTSEVTDETRQARKKHTDLKSKRQLQMKQRLQLLKQKLSKSDTTIKEEVKEETELNEFDIDEFLKNVKEEQISQL